MTAAQIHEILIAKIRKGNIRDHDDPETLKGLSQSIREVGQLYPVILGLEVDEYFLKDGHRRVAALEALGRSTVLAIVDATAPSDGDTLAKALIANAQREGLRPLATAKAIARLMKTTGWNASETAGRLGFPASRVTMLLSYLRLPAELAARLSANGIGTSVAYQLSRIDDPARQAELAQRVLQGEVTRDGAIGVVRRIKKPTASNGQRRPARAVATVGRGRSVTVSGIESSLDGFIACLEEALNRARRSRTKGHSLATFCKTLRDEAKSAGIERR